MTDKEIEKTYKNMMETDAPDLWERIDSQLEPREMKMKKSIWKRIGNFLFGGGTIRTAITVCVLCVIVFGVVGRAFSATGWMMMGASSSDSAATTESAGTTSSSSSARGSVSSYASADEVVEDAEVYGEEGGTVEVGSSGENVTVDDETASQETERKLIRTIWLDVETMDFDNLVSDIQKQVVEMGGYVEASSVSGNSYYYSSSRYAQLTLRIPTDATDEFLAQVDESSNVISQSENVEDITLTYVDIQSHINALETEEEQLLELLEAAETVEDIITIQSELSDVRYQLESYESQLRTYDNLVDYDTVTIWIDEVTKETPTEELSIWQQMKNGFMDSIEAIRDGFKDLCIWVVANIPYFVILFVVVLVIVAIIKKIKRGRKKKLDI